MFQKIADKNEVSKSTTGGVLELAMERGTVAPFLVSGSEQKLSVRDKREIMRTSATKHRLTPLKEIVPQEEVPIRTTKLRSLWKMKASKVLHVIKALSTTSIKDRMRASLEAQELNWDKVMFTDAKP